MTLEEEFEASSAGEGGREWIWQSLVLREMIDKEGKKEFEPFRIQYRSLEFISSHYYHRGLACLSRMATAVVGSENHMSAVNKFRSGESSRGMTI